MKGMTIKKKLTVPIKSLNILFVYKFIDEIQVKHKSY